MNDAQKRHSRPNRIVTNDRESREWLDEYAERHKITKQAAVREAVQAGVAVLKLSEGSPE